MSGVRTFVLAGFDESDALEDARAAYAANPNVTVVRPVEGEDIADTLSRYGIGNNNIGAENEKINIVLAMHGGEDDHGKVHWEKGKWISYDDVFKALRQDGSVQSISVASCYGGTAVKE